MHTCRLAYSIVSDIRRWKDMYPVLCLVAHFSRALDLMNHALAGRRLPGLQENMAYFTTTERRSAQSLLVLLHPVVFCVNTTLSQFSFRKEAELTAAMEKRRVSYKCPPTILFSVHLQILPISSFNLSSPFLPSLFCTIPCLYFSPPSHSYNT